MIECTTSGVNEIKWIRAEQHTHTVLNLVISTFNNINWLKFMFEIGRGGARETPLRCINIPVSSQSRASYFMKIWKLIMSSYPEIGSMQYQIIYVLVRFRCAWQSLDLILRPLEIIRHSFLSLEISSSNNTFIFKMR